MTSAPAAQPCKADVFPILKRLKNTLPLTGALEPKDEEICRGLCTRRGFSGPGTGSKRRGYSEPGNVEPSAVHNPGALLPKGADRAPADVPEPKRLHRA